MKHLAAVLALLMVGVLSGCDGRGKILYLQPATAMKPPWSVASVVIPIQGSENVVGIVTKVATDLHMMPDAKDPHRWSVALSERDSFQLSVQKDVGGYWMITLADWPSTQRSPQSLKAEAEIRSALKEPNQSLQPTAPSGRD